MNRPDPRDRPRSHWVMAALLGAIAFVAVNVAIDLATGARSNLVLTFAWALGLSGALTWVLHQKANRERR